jgi:hypothetical protein
VAGLVPAEQPIYLCRLKDEGVLFYTGRATRRVARLGQVPVGRMALLTDQEWQSQGEEFEAVAWLHDEQGAPMVMGRRR